MMANVNGSAWVTALLAKKKTEENTLQMTAAHPSQAYALALLLVLKVHLRF